jgi:hypothetical protein
MTEFIIKYWLEFVFGVIVAILTASYNKIKAKLNKTEDEYNALKQAMIAMLHDRVYQSCTHYLTLGYIPVEKAEEILDNIQMIYDAYHVLGGNGTGTEIYKRFKALPIKSVETVSEVLDEKV